MRDCPRRREVGKVPAEGIQPVATEDMKMTKQDNAAKKAARRDASPHHQAAWLFLAATPDQTTACDREEARAQ